MFRSDERFFPLTSCSFLSQINPPPQNTHSTPSKTTEATADAIVLRIESGADHVTASSWDASLLICAGDDPLALAEHATARAAALSSGGASPPRLAKALPPSIDDFGWCTWDACYSRVSASILEEGVRTLKEGGVPPRTLVIDDGWQCTDVDPVFRKKRPPISSSSGPSQTSSTSSSSSPASPGAGGGGSSKEGGKEKRGKEGGDDSSRSNTSGGSGSTSSGNALLESVERAAESVEAAVEAAVGNFEADARAAAAVARAALDGAAAAAEYEFEAAERRALASAAREAAPGSSLGAALAGLAPPPDSAVEDVDTEDDVGLGEEVGGVGSGYSGSDGDGGDEMARASSSESSYSSDSGSNSDGNGGGNRRELRRRRSSTRATVDAFPPLPEQHAPRGRPKPPTDLASLEAAATGGGGAGTVSSEAEAAEAAAAAAAALSTKAERNRYLTDSDSDETRSGSKTSSSSSLPRAASIRRLSAPQRQPPRLPGVAGAAGGRAADLRSGPAAVGLAAISAVFFLAKALQRAVGASLGGAEAAGAKLYAAVVEPAPADSWQVRAFAAAARGPLRPVLLEFYAAASDFTRRLTDVRANSKFSRPGATPEDYWSGAPERLGEVVKDLKERLGVKHVIVWHALSCYWGGVAPAGEEVVEGSNSSSSSSSATTTTPTPSSPSSASSLHPAVAKYDARIIYAKPTPGVAEIEPSMLWNPAVLAGVGVISDPKALYSDLHSYLASAGVDGVKVDGQAGAGLIGSALDGGPATARKHHEALEESVSTFLPGNHLTNCMCHSTENLFLASKSVLARASDDFYPRDRASSAAHVGACAYNAVFLSGILLPDWDMFHSRHPAARLHAAARAVSGGPVYVSDAPGAHDFGLLRRLVLKDGRVLRALLPARPTADTLFEDPQRDERSLLKVWNANAHTVVVAALHVQGSAWCRERRRFVRHDDAPPPLGCKVSPSDAVGSGWVPPSPKEEAEEGGGGENQTSSSSLRFDGRWVAAFSGVDAHHHSHHHHHHHHHGHSKASSKSGSGSGGGGVFLLDSATSSLDVELEGGGTSLVTMAPVAVVDKGPASIAFAPLGLRSMFNGGGAVASFELGEGGKGGEEEGEEKSSSPRARVGVVGAAPFSSFCSQQPSSVREGATLEDLEWRWDERCGELVVNPPSSEGGGGEGGGDWSFEVLF